MDVSLPLSGYRNPLSNFFPMGQCLLGDEAPRFMDNNVSFRGLQCFDSQGLAGSFGGDRSLDKQMLQEVVHKTGEPQSYGQTLMVCIAEWVVRAFPLSNF